MQTKHIVAAAIIGIGAIGTAAGFAAPASAEPADPNQEQRDELFTKAVRDAGLRITPKKAISIAESTCAVLSRGGTVNDALLHVREATDWETPKDITTLGSLSVQAYCPTSMPAS